MPLKVYAVDFQLTTYVLAESKKDAEEQVTTDSCEWVKNTDLAAEATILVAEEVTDINTVPEDWQGCYPHTRFTGLELKTIKQQVSDTIEPPKPDQD